MTISKTPQKDSAFEFAKAHGWTIESKIVGRHMKYFAIHGTGSVEATGYGSLEVRMRKHLEAQGAIPVKVFVKSESKGASETTPARTANKLLHDLPRPALNWTTSSEKELRELAGPESCAIMDSLTEKAAASISQGHYEGTRINLHNLPRNLSAPCGVIAQRIHDEVTYFSKTASDFSEAEKRVLSSRPWQVRINGVFVASKGSRKDALKLVRRLYSGAQIYAPGDVTIVYSRTI